MGDERGATVGGRGCGRQVRGLIYQCLFKGTRLNASEYALAQPPPVPLGFKEKHEPKIVRRNSLSSRQVILLQVTHVTRTYAHARGRHDAPNVQDCVVEGGEGGVFFGCGLI